MSISKYSTVPAENTDPTHGAPEGMQAGTVNNVQRQDKANQRAQWNDAEWFEYLDGTQNGTAAYAASNQFTISGNDATAHYHVGRRVKITNSSGGNVKYGTISAVSAYGAGSFTVTITGDTLTNETILVYTGILSVLNYSIPPKVVQDIAGAMVSGNTETGLSVDYVADKLNFSLTITHEQPFTTALKDKLDGIAASANNYSHPTDAGNKHIPAGGATDQILKYSASGTAVWSDPGYALESHNHAETYMPKFTIHTGTTPPSSSLGENGDLYIQHD